ncbi:hypothetical protein NC652_008448 [Populus alba x Populus x berolinensis]|nr:hypothetical protein NC652_008448 [Populus alba x Populus x berolinensis]
MSFFRFYQSRSEIGTKSHCRIPIHQLAIPQKQPSQAVEETEDEESTGPNPSQEQKTDPPLLTRSPKSIFSSHQTSQVRILSSANIGFQDILLT